jgi:hypothetical protein
MELLGCLKRAMGCGIIVLTWTWESGAGESQGARLARKGERAGPLFDPRNTRVLGCADGGYVFQDPCGRKHSESYSVLIMGRGGVVFRYISRRDIRACEFARNREKVQGGNKLEIRREVGRCGEAKKSASFFLFFSSCT